MICIKFTEKFDFEYDIQGIVRSFYPEENLKSIRGEENHETEKPVLTVECHFGEGHMALAITDLTGRISGAEFERVYIQGEYSRKETKNLLKRELYTILSEYTHKELPWGTLSGIRPTKITSALLALGLKEKAVYKHMKEEYFLSDIKAQESIAISKRELEILKKIDYSNGYSLYVGIPFCPSTCLYCSFTSYPIGIYRNKTERYLEALIRELEFCAGVYGNKRLCTIYIGGGTPTALSAKQLDRLLLRISQLFDTKRLYEYTIEAGRPDSITEEKLATIRKYDITRISINPQTMSDETLRLIGRHHTTDRFLQAYDMARKEGFDNINMDFILGLPGEKLSDVKNSMSYVLRLKPDSLTIHSLAVKRAARLNLEKRLGREFDIKNDEEMMQVTRDAAMQLGMNPYYLYRQKNMAGNLENVGYALPGREGIYNVLIMEEKQTILAVGAGASSKMVRHKQYESRILSAHADDDAAGSNCDRQGEDDEITRIENVKDVDLYIERIDEMIERKRRYIVNHASDR